MSSLIRAGCHEEVRGIGHCEESGINRRPPKANMRLTDGVAYRAQRQCMMGVKVSGGRGAMQQTMQEAAARRWLLVMTTFGGALAGAGVGIAFQQSPHITPFVFYSIVGLSGTVFGALSAIGVLTLRRARLPVVARHALLAGAGFTMSALIAIGINQVWIGSFTLTALFLPCIMGILWGRIASRWLWHELGIAGARLPIGWGWGALIYTPTLIPPLYVAYSLFYRAFSSYYEFLFWVFGGACTGAVGGFLSARVTLGSLKAARAQASPYAPAAGSI
jgi:hypothetical protein